MKMKEFGPGVTRPSLPLLDICYPLSIKVMALDIKRLDILILICSHNSFQFSGIISA